LSAENEQNLLEALQERILGPGSIVLLSSLTSTNGVKRDWNQIANLCTENESIFILDISNSVGHEVHDFKSIQPDIVISSGSVGALGPPGTAFQIIKNSLSDNLHPLIVGRNSIIALEEYRYQLTSSGSKFETGIMNVGEIKALSTSLKILSSIGFSRIKKHEEHLHNYLREELSNIKGIDLLHFQDLDYGPILSFGCEKLEAHDIAMILEDTNNIIVRSGALCAHLFMYDQKYNDLVRVSTHLYNNFEEAETFIKIIKSII